MPRWLWFAPLGALVTALAALGFRMGWIAATITETDVIEALSSHYVASETDASRSDCTARPGNGRPVWIVVRCVHADGRAFDYPVDNMGRLLPAHDKPDMVMDPQT